MTLRKGKRLELLWKGLAFPNNMKKFWPGSFALRFKFNLRTTDILKSTHLGRRHYLWFLLLFVVSCIWAAVHLSPTLAVLTVVDTAEVWAGALACPFYFQFLVVYFWIKGQSFTFSGQIKHFWKQEVENKLKSGHYLKTQEASLTYKIPNRIFLLSTRSFSVVSVWGSMSENGLLGSLLGAVTLLREMCCQGWALKSQMLKPGLVYFPPAACWSRSRTLSYLLLWGHVCHASIVMIVD